MQRMRDRTFSDPKITPSKAGLLPVFLYKVCDLYPSQFLAQCFSAADFVIDPFSPDPLGLRADFVVNFKVCTVVIRVHHACLGPSRIIKVQLPVPAILELSEVWDAFPGVVGDNSGRR